jgi:hypothetical protein
MNDGENCIRRRFCARSRRGHQSKSSTDGIDRDGISVALYRRQIVGERRPRLGEAQLDKLQFKTRRRDRARARSVGLPFRTKPGL